MADLNSARFGSDEAIAADSHAKSSTECVVAIDPGSAKCGLAIVNRGGETPFRSVVPTSSLPAELARVVAVYRPREIVIGNGTSSKHALDAIRDALSAPLSIRTVPEGYTSEEARKRYLAEVRPRGLQRLLPSALRTPTIPYDDYVAMILGERYWRLMAQESPGPSKRISP